MEGVEEITEALRRLLFVDAGGSRYLSGSGAQSVQSNERSKEMASKGGNETESASFSVVSMSHLASRFS